MAENASQIGPTVTNAAASETKAESSTSTFLNFIGAGTTDKNKLTPGFTEFYLGVLYGNPYNNFTPRNKFKISWNLFDANYKTDYAPEYQTLSKQINSIMNQFKMHIDHIDMPGLTIANGSVLNDGKGTYYVHSDQMIAPETNEITVWFRDTQISIVDLVGMWMNFNATPWKRPIRLNLNVDYYSDFDGKTSVMAYKIAGCVPIERDLIKATHDGREINVRGIKFGFNNIVPVATDGGSSGTDAISKNWNKFLKQIEEASAQKQETSVWSDIGKSWSGSSGVIGTTGALAKTIVTGEPAKYNTGSEEKSALSAVGDAISSGASATWDFTSNLFSSEEITDNKQTEPSKIETGSDNNGSGVELTSYDESERFEYEEKADTYPPSEQARDNNANAEVHSQQTEPQKVSANDETASHQSQTEPKKTGEVAESNGRSTEEFLFGDKQNTTDNAVDSPISRPILIDVKQKSEIPKATIPVSTNGISAGDGKPSTFGIREFSYREKNGDDPAVLTVRSTETQNLIESYVVPDSEYVRIDEKRMKDESGNTRNSIDFISVDKITGEEKFRVTTYQDSATGKYIYKSSSGNGNINVPEEKTVSQVNQNSSSTSQQSESSNKTSTSNYSVTEVNSDDFSERTPRVGITQF